MTSKRISVRSCIKRLQDITINELSELSNRDLNGIMKLDSLVGPVAMEIDERRRQEQVLHNIKENNNGGILHARQD